MSTENGRAQNGLEAKLNLVNEKVRFSAKARSNPEIMIDYFPPLGDGEGYTSLELLLCSFSSCISSVALAVLRGKMQKTVSSLSAVVKGTVREEHPKSLSHITVELDIASPDIEESDIKTVLSVAGEKLCPVWAMIKGNVEVDVTYKLRKP